MFTFTAIKMDSEKLRKIVLISSNNASYLRQNSDNSSSESDSDEEIRRKIPKVLNYQEIVCSYDDTEFKRNFRLQRSTYNKLKEFLCEKLSYGGRNQSVPQEKKILMTLWYLGNSDSFRQLSILFNISISTAHLVIVETIDTIVKFSPQFIKWPTEAESNLIANRFYTKKPIRNVIGAIDGTHITIRKLNDDNDYINRKGYPSIILQGVVDDTGKFIDIHCDEPGSVHDSRVLKKSSLYKKLEDRPHLIYGKVILGDSAYMVRNWLIPPFKDNGALTDEQRSFNAAHSSLRVIIENAFGILKNRFRRLFGFENIQKQFVVKAVIASVVLHNICVTNGDIFENIDREDEFEEAIPSELEDSNMDRNINMRQTVFNNFITDMRLG